MRTNLQTIAAADRRRSAAIIPALARALASGAIPHNADERVGRIRDALASGILRRAEIAEVEALAGGVQKTAGMTTADTAALADLREASEAWLTAGTVSGVFDTIAAAAWQGSLHSALKIITTLPIAAGVSEGVAKPVGRMAASAPPLTALKSAALIVLSRELARWHGSDSAIDAALRAAVIASADALTLPVLVSGAGSVAASGSDAVSIRDDLRRALGLITAATDAALFLVLPVAVLRRLALLADDIGGSAFPDLTVNGGSIDGLQVIPTDQEDDDAVIVDARGFATASDPIMIDRSGHASIGMVGTPSNSINNGAGEAVEQSMVSMFQTDSVAVRAERRIGLAPVRAGGVAIVTDVAAAWGLSGSPLS